MQWIWKIGVLALSSGTLLPSIVATKGRARFGGVVRTINLRGRSEAKCQLCKIKSEIPIGTWQCESCGHEYDQVCAGCFGRPCPKCRKGALKRPEEVFPNSLFRAAREGQIEDVTRLLRERKAGPDSLFNRDGHSLLSIAAVGANTPAAYPLCERLLATGASVHVRDKKTGRTPLMNLAIYRKFRKDLMGIFISSINDRDDAGRTALMFASEGAGFFGNPKGHAGMARELLELGADASAEDNQGRTALGHAMMSNKNGKNEDMVDLLQEAMVQQAALREFNKRFSSSFTKAGVLKTTPSRRPRSSNSRK